LDKVNRLFPGEFYMNAFNITDSKMEYFDNVGENEITFDHVRAAFALPFFYPPYEMDNGQVYIEGATRDPLSFGNLKDRVDSIDIKNVVVVDLLDSLDRVLVREPYDLQDAYAISVMTPAIALAERTLEDLQKSHPEIPINRIKFNITARHDHHVLEWSRSNLKHLWQVGYNAGIEFYNDEENKGKNKKLLTRNPPPKRTPPRANNRDNAEE
jgi:predicted acylesterase/phospholipase RssA